jgi:hypothetical protein
MILTPFCFAGCFSAMVHCRITRVHLPPFSIKQKESPGSRFPYGGVCFQIVLLLTPVQCQHSLWWKGDEYPSCTVNERFREKLHIRYLEAVHAEKLEFVAIIATAEGAGNVLTAHLCDQHVVLERKETAKDIRRGEVVYIINLLRISVYKMFSVPPNNCSHTSYIYSLRSYGLIYLHHRAPPSFRKFDIFLIAPPKYKILSSARPNTSSPCSFRN